MKNENLIDDVYTVGILSVGEQGSMLIIITEFGIELRKKLRAKRSPCLFWFASQVVMREAETLRNTCRSRSSWRLSDPLNQNKTF